MQKKKKVALERSLNNNVNSFLKQTIHFNLNPDFLKANPAGKSRWKDERLHILSLLAERILSPTTEYPNDLEDSSRPPEPSGGHQECKPTLENIFSQ